MKTRREILQGLIVSIGGSSLLTACDGFAKIAPTVDGELRFYSSEEIELVTKISDLIIPRTDTPGASDVNVSGFLDGLMAEWANAETRENHHRTSLFQTSGIYITQTPNRLLTTRLFYFSRHH